MKITSIRVVAGRTLPHPSYSYANLKASVVLDATIELEESADACVRALQAKAEGLVDDHMRSLTDSIEEAEISRRREDELRSMEDRIQEMQQRLNQLRSGKLLPAEAVPQCDVEVLEEADRPY